MLTPADHFDELRFSFVQKEWRKSAYVIGCVLHTFRDESLVDDAFLGTRLQVLADAGRIEAAGDLREIRFSEVRLWTDETA